MGVVHVADRTLLGEGEMCPLSCTQIKVGSKNISVKLHREADQFRERAEVLKGLL